MTPFESGAYVSWRLYPAVRVSVDSRYEVAYPNWWGEESLRFNDASPGWERTLEAHPTDVVLVRKTAAVARVIGTKGWTRIYADRAFEAYGRRGLELPAVDYSGRVFDGRFP